MLPLWRSLALMLGVWLLFPGLRIVVADPELAFASASLLATVMVVAFCVPARTILRTRSLYLAALGVAAGATAALAANASRAWLPLAGASGLPAPTSPIRLSTFLAVILLAPVFEELLYRRRLLDALRTLWGPVPALLASSVLFALAHGEPRAMLIPLLGGIASAVLVLRTGSIAPSIGVHVGWNAIAMLGSAGANAGTQSVAGPFG